MSKIPDIKDSHDRSHINRVNTLLESVEVSVHTITRYEW